MPVSPILKDIPDAIDAASRLIESKFFQVGERLESSVEVLTRLTASLERLHAELEGDGLRQATRALSQAAARVTEMGRAGSGDRVTLGRLHAVIEGIAVRLGHMHEAVKDADALAINAKIASAVISVVGVDFESFAKEIGRTVRLARQSLDEFGAELRGARDRVAAAISRDASFERQNEEAAASISVRIRGAVESLAVQNGRAAQATPRSWNEASPSASGLETRSSQCRSATRRISGSSMSAWGCAFCSWRREQWPAANPTPSETTRLFPRSAR